MLRKLGPSFRERVWGARTLDPWFPQAAAKAGPFPIGEVWFEPEGVPLLLKFLFAAEDLSVQVHPGDAYARFHHSSPGKTEMWHVLAAEPGARIAAGFKETITGEQARSAALDGSIMNLLEWFEAKPGDTFFIPAGTVHAIGGGLTICEIQQPSDIVYRFYDHGRGRELHLDRALAVSKLGPFEARSGAKVICEYFVTDLVEAPASLPGPDRQLLLIAIGGEGGVNGEPVRAGEVVQLTVSPEPIEITGSLRLIRTFVPSS